MDRLHKYALILQPKNEFKEWLKKISFSISISQKEIEKITLEELRQDSTIYLINSVEKFSDLDSFLKDNFLKIFDCELAIRCDKKELWPKDRNLALFFSWFSPELSAKIYDARSIDTK